MLAKKIISFHFKEKLKIGAVRLIKKLLQEMERSGCMAKGD